MRIYVIKNAAVKESGFYLSSIENGNIAAWKNDGYGNRVRTLLRNPKPSDGSILIRTATYTQDIEKAMTFEGIAAAREFIAQESVLRYCVPALKNREVAEK